MSSHTSPSHPVLDPLAAFLLEARERTPDHFREMIAFLSRYLKDESFRSRVDAALDRDESCLADPTTRAWILGGES